MLDTIKENHVARAKPGNKSIFTDELISTYYQNYYDNLTSKQLDRKFNNDISSLVGILSKLSQENRDLLIGSLSSLIELYIERKVEKEIEFSFHKLLKF